MNRWCQRLVIVLAVAVGGMPLLANAQNGATRRLIAFAQDRSQSGRASVRQSIELAPEPNTDEVIRGLKLATLTDGRTFVQFEEHGPPPSRTSFSVATNRFVAVDPQSRTYRSFILHGPYDEDARVRAHVKSKFGLEWAPPRRQVGRLAPVPQNRIAERPARGARATSSRMEPRIRLVGGGGQLAFTCSGDAGAYVGNVDVLGIGLAEAQSTVNYTGGVDWFGSFWYPGAYSYTYPRNPTSLGTHWYNGAVYRNENTTSWNYVMAEQDAIMWNLDFASVILFGAIPDFYTEVEDYTHADGGLSGAYAYS